MKEKVFANKSVVKAYDKVRVVKSELLSDIQPTQKAYDVAKENGLDLICITKNANPPVCILQTVGKFQYNKSKVEKKQKSNNKQLSVKEIRLSPNIAQHDFEVRVKQANKFLKKGHEVKLSLQFKGREIVHDDLGFDVMGRFINSVSEVSELKNKPKKDGRYIRAYLAPIK